MEGCQRGEEAMLEVAGGLILLEEKYLSNGICSPELIQPGVDPNNKGFILYSLNPQKQIVPKT